MRQESRAVKPLRLLAIASAGGHWSQLCRLIPLFEEHDTLYLTTLDGARVPTGCRPLRVVADASRSEPLGLLLLWANMLWAMVSFRPHVVMTTGAAPGLIALQIGKMLGAHTVWIDSIANVDELSMSGRLARRVADLRLTQWEHLADAASGVRYFGSVL